VTFINLRKRDLPEPDEALEDVDPDEATEGDEQDQESEGHVVPGLLGALYQGVRGWCAWCSARIGVGPTWALHGFAFYAAEHYSVWVTYGVTGPFMLAVFLFTPREPLERVAARLDARDAAREARRARSTAPAEDAVDEAPEEPAADPLPALMWRLIGDAPGVHLKTLTEALAMAAEKVGQRPPLKADVEAALEARGITLRPSVRDTREKVNKGVHRDDLRAWETALSPPGPADPATGP
jgi:hypothetical protein